ncbi:hypothetical protein CC2G_010070 [Coprinopsis cinerea AmutBmut pab1-1]|nr:hypothetical protein CC2G_010070 [Coprinopsis cinerea AmutBmut pab1-1]
MPKVSPQRREVIVHGYWTRSEWTAASLTMLIIDYLETLPLEMKYMWFGKTTKVKIAYFVTRYSIFAFYILAFICFTSHGH